MRERDIAGVHVKLKDIEEDVYTGLEVSKDPGVPIVWIGFLSILIGFLINIFVHHLDISKVPGLGAWAALFVFGFVIIFVIIYINVFTYHRRIYLLQTTEGTLVAGIPKKNKELFKAEFEKWREKTHALA